VRGYIYLLTNPHMAALIKTDRTDRSPYVRAAELSAATGVPGRYVVQQFWQVPDAEVAERRAFATLAAYRVRGSEHFRIGLPEAVGRIEQVLGTTPVRPTRWRRIAERAVGVFLLVLAAVATLRRLQHNLRRLRAALR
jgi:hypothetical protein